ncbi:MAG: hypothetical protein ACM3ZV_06950 [Bacillota bacterium]
MSTYTTTQTFTLTNAKYLASKVRTDLKRIQRFYGVPTDGRIDEYEAELTEFLRYGYVSSVTYGFQRNGQWIQPTLRYTAAELISGVNDNPGGIVTGADVTGASFSSYMIYSSKWWEISETGRAAFRSTLPFARGTADEPSINGYLVSDRSYSSGGTSLSRQSVVSW